MKTIQEIFNVVIHYEFFSPDQPYMGFALFDAFYDGILTRAELNLGLRELKGKNPDNDNFPYETRLAWFKDWDKYKKDHACTTSDC